ncbi:hypothetical protein KFK09_029071 [Dendrobium nobile]|uniref:Uncharacterized protein n=1 Tax=Dendrobium nobile TaxID=94219 RepID=A0A8T3A580_DENNO|nr:hypothetical protein KFK09_029071 [Dendrobium nobile]
MTLARFTGFEQRRRAEFGAEQVREKHFFFFLAPVYRSTHTSRIEKHFLACLGLQVFVVKLLNTLVKAVKRSKSRLLAQKPDDASQQQSQEAKQELTKSLPTSAEEDNFSTRSSSALC